MLSETKETVDAAADAPLLTKTCDCIDSWCVGTTAAVVVSVPSREKLWRGSGSRSPQGMTRLNAEAVVARCSLLTMTCRMVRHRAPHRRKSTRRSTASSRGTTCFAHTARIGQSEHRSRVVCSPLGSVTDLQCLRHSQVVKANNLPRRTAFLKTHIDGLILRFDGNLPRGGEMNGAKSGNCYRGLVSKDCWLRQSHQHVCISQLARSRIARQHGVPRQRTCPKGLREIRVAARLSQRAVSSTRCVVRVHDHWIDNYAKTRF